MSLTIISYLMLLGFALTIWRFIRISCLLQQLENKSFGDSLRIREVDRLVIQLYKDVHNDS